jgi:hypothetical protein
MDALDVAVQVQQRAALALTCAKPLPIADGAPFY